MKDKKQTKTAPKSKADPEQRSRTMKQIVFVIISVILILSWILSLTMKF